MAGREAMRKLSLVVPGQPKKLLPRGVSQAGPVVRPGPAEEEATENMDVIIRAAAPEDAPAMSGILAESWKAAYAGIVPQKYLDSLNAGNWHRLRNDISAGTLKALLLFVDGVPAGAVGYGKSRDESHADWGEIVCLYLRPGFWRRGYGGKLLQAAVDDLMREGFREFYLWVLAENRRAQAFYHAMGFAPTEDTCFYEIAGERIKDVRYIRRLDG